MKRWLKRLLLVSGIVCLGLWGWSTIGGALYQFYGNYALERRLRGAAPSGGGSRAADGSFVGRLEIPRLKVRAMVREGISERTLGVALGHIPGTALPGQPGNVGVAGHRDTLFRPLQEIDHDDLIVFQTATARYHYRVVATSVVAPSMVGVLKNRGGNDLTLVTCFPFRYVGPAPQRFIVKARLVSGRETRVASRARL